MSVFICPICGGPLEHGEKRLFCARGHSFDISSEGYVHLLPPNRMNSKIPGDSAAMAAARTAFLNRGFYAPLRSALAEEIFSLFPGGGETVLDCGCGEGYYTAGIYEYLCCIRKEQVFLKNFSRNDVVDSLRRYHRQYEELIENICELFLRVNGRGNL